MARPSVFAVALVLLAMMLLAGAVPDMVSTEAVSEGRQIEEDITLTSASLEQIQEEAFGESIPAPLEMAKKACQAGWLETKKQCNLVTASTTETMALLKIQIKSAGAAIGQAVLATIKETSSSNSTSANSTGVEYRALRLRVSQMTEAFERLGESVDMAAHNADETAQKKTLAHMACQAMWQQVEALCTKADQKSDEGVEQVKETIKTEGDTFETKGNTVADKATTPAAAPTTNTTQTRLGESKQDNKPDTVFLEDMLTENDGQEVVNLDITELLAEGTFA